MQIEWDEVWARGAVIDDYNVEIQSALGDWQTMALCSGDGLLCSIDMISLYDAPISLLFNDPILVRVSATNLIGTSVWSDTEQSTTLRQVPQKMNNPARGALTSEL